MPARFAADTDDLLMRSLIKRYALEGKTDGAPNGKFYLDYGSAYAVADEVVGSHFGFSGEKKAKYLEGKFDDLWTHYDVINQGWSVSFLPRDPLKGGGTIRIIGLRCPPGGRGNEFVVWC